ncbi:MAG: RsmD family RNA methyltransferase [Prevotella sp.]|nr:RsmD family RNA methyltransferase [Prevotella sp.]
MRIITGIYEGRRFDIPRTFKARPTTDFAKENIFNVLNGYIDLDGKRALDLFAGTGSISLEFLSRGCSQVVSVEGDREHHAFIKQCMARLGTECSVVVRGDVFKFLNNCHQQFDIIFADPPYALPRLSELPSIVLGSGLLADDGLFVLEHGKQDDFSEMPQFVERRQYGSVNFSLFRNNAFTAAENKKESD